MTNNRLKKSKNKPEGTQVEVQRGNVDVLTVSLLNSINTNIAELLKEIRGRQGK